MASSTLGRRSTWTEGDKAIAAKYPANFHPEIIALRENNIKSRKSRELLKDDIGLLEKRKFQKLLISKSGFTLDVNVNQRNQMQLN